MDNENDIEEIEHEESTEVIEVDIQSLCRLCGNMHINLNPIFEGTGLTNELSNKIKDYLQIIVTEDDILPQNICNHCTSNLLSWDDFYKGCNDTNKKLHIMISNADENFDEKSLTEINELNDEIKSEGYLEIQEIDYLHSDDAKEQSVDDENNESAKETEQEQNVDLRRLVANPRNYTRCSRLQLTQSATNKNANEQLNERIDHFVPDNDDSEDAVILSIVDTHFNKNIKIYDEDKFEKDGTYFQVEENLYNGMFIKRNGKFICPHCNETYEKGSDFVTHMTTKHGYDQTTLNKAKTRYKVDKKLAEKAMFIHSDGKARFKCPECEKILMTVYTFSWHLRIHTGEKNFVCHLCTKRFRILQGLARHLRETHEQLKIFPCDICGRKFGNRRNVSEHRRLHSGERPYKCSTCSKTFKQKASLFIHNRSHQTTFPYHCPHCNLGFRSKTPMMNHIAIHTGERPHECDICHRKFRIKHEMNRHKLIHSDLKPFICEQCPLSFRQKRYLMRHYKSRHPDKKDP